MELTQEEVAKVVYASIIMAIKDMRDNGIGDDYHIGFPDFVTIDDSVYEFISAKERLKCH